MDSHHQTTMVTPSNSDCGRQYMGVLAGMQPAFRHAHTGELHLAVQEDGAISPVYGFSGLPDNWIVERDVQGRPTALHPDIIAGYWRDGRFIALSQLNSLPLDD